MHVTYTLEPIGLIQREGERTWIEIAREHRPALLGLSGFSHIEVIWWCHYTDSEQARTTKQFSPPFDAPVMGVLASRAPMRPNPLATSTVPLLSVDVTTGVLALGEIDAFDLTPVIDIKPYLPMYSRVRLPRVPKWAAEWPAWLPENGIPPRQVQSPD
jgi:tRNA-Thr(GGU) m(6)t(6)A37 methyltransferase TsaA